MSAEEIANIITQDEYDVAQVLDNWLEFLQPHQIESQILYKIYHFSFCDWLRQQLTTPELPH